MERKRPSRSNATQAVPPTPGQPVKEPMVIPLSLGLVGKNGRDLPLKLSTGEWAAQHVVVLTEERAGFEFGEYC